MWFDEGELAHLAKAGPAAVRRLDDRYRDTGLYTRRTDVRCPNCRVALTPFTLPHAPEVKLDGCRECRGVWVDDGELAALVASAARATGPRS